MTAIASPIPILQNTFNQLALQTEQFDPTTQVETYINSHKTGTKRLSTCVYHDTLGTRGIFGVDLDSYCLRERVDVPYFIVKCVSVIDGCMSHLPDDTEPIDIWYERNKYVFISRLDSFISLENVYSIRSSVESEDLKTNQGAEMLSFLNAVPVSTIIGGILNQ